MSEHMTWNRLYTAIYDNDAATVAEALYYLDTRALVTCLESSRTCLEIAAKLGHEEIVDIVLESRAFRALEAQHEPKLLVQLVTRAFLEACSFGSLNLVKAFLDFADEYSDTNDTACRLPEHSIKLALRCAAREGAMDIVVYLLQAYSNYLDTELPHELVQIAYEQGHDFTSLLQFETIDKFVQKQIFDDNFFDVVDFAKLSFIKVDVFRRTIIEQASAYGREDVLYNLYDKYTWPQKDDDFEYGLDLAIELGRTNVCELMFIERWVSVSMNHRWERRLQRVVDNDRTEAALFLIEHFLPAIVTRTNEQTEQTRQEQRLETTTAQGCFPRRELKKVAEISDDNRSALVISMLKSAVYNNNLILSRRLLDYAADLHDSTDEINGIFDTAVTMGLPRLARLFHGHGHQSSSCVGQGSRWGRLNKMKMNTIGHPVQHGPDCYHASPVNANVVISEHCFLGQACHCWRLKTRGPILGQALVRHGQTCGDVGSQRRGCTPAHCDHVIASRQTEIVKILLKRFKDDQAADKSAGKAAEQEEANTEKKTSESGKRDRTAEPLYPDYREGNTISVYSALYYGSVLCRDGVGNRHILTTWYDCYNVTSPWSHFNMEHLKRLNLFDICQVIRTLCGTSLKRCFKQGLVAALDRLSPESKEIFYQCVNESGLELWNLMDVDELGFYTGKQIRTMRRPLSLQSNCRVTIRRTVRSRQPVGSLEDKLLGMEHVLPRDVVDYLLFRSEPLPTNLRDGELLDPSTRR